MAYTITGTVQGIKSTAFSGAKSPTITRPSNNKYRIVISQNFTTDISMATYIYARVSDRSVNPSSYSIISGNAYVRSDEWEWAVESTSSYSIDVEFPENATEITVGMTGLIINGGMAKYTFNGSTGWDGWGCADYTWAIKSPISACTPPSSVSSDLSLADLTQTVHLNWSAGGAGTGNPITCYEIQRAESSNGTSFGAWSSLTTSTTSGIVISPPITVGNYYKYRVRTQGGAGEAYFSAWVESSNTLRRKYDPFGTYTDPTLTRNSTYIKAIHMTEMQERLSTLLAFYSKTPKTFTTITAGITSLGGWKNHIQELRDAVDAISTNHETWILFTENCPRVDVVEQLRRVINQL